MYFVEIPTSRSLSFMQAMLILSRSIVNLKIL